MTRKRKDELAVDVGALLSSITQQVQQPSIFKPYAIYMKMPNSENIMKILNVDFSREAIEYLPFRVYDGQYAAMHELLPMIYGMLTSDRGIWVKPDPQENIDG